MRGATRAASGVRTSTIAAATRNPHGTDPSTIPRMESPKDMVAFIA